MPIEIPYFVIITSNKTFGQEKEEHRWATLQNCFVRCPRCSEIWLVPGANKNEEHLCAHCRHNFLINSLTIVN
jgi:acetyl-CoA carboxylase beta subunit